MPHTQLYCFIGCHRGNRELCSCTDRLCCKPTNAHWLRYAWSYIKIHLHVFYQCAFVGLLHKVNTVGSRFATVRFTTIHFYDPCRVGPNPRLVVPHCRNSSVLSVRSALLALPVCMRFSFSYFSAVILIVVFPPMTHIKKTEKKKKSKQLTLHSFLMSSEPRPGPSSAHKRWFYWYFFQVSVLFSIYVIH